MLNSKFCEGSPPVLQINDIRYEIFDTVSGKKIANTHKNDYKIKFLGDEIPVQGLH